MKNSLKCPFCKNNQGDELGYHLQDKLATGFDDIHTLDAYIEYICKGLKKEK